MRESDASSWAALDAVYAREGGSGIVKLGGSADARIVLWARVRGLRPSEFEENDRDAAKGCAAMQLVRYARSGNAAQVLAALLGTSNRRVMRLVSSSWRDFLQAPRWRQEEREQEMQLKSLLDDIVGIQGRFNSLCRSMWDAFDPQRLPAGAIIVPRSTEAEHMASRMEALRSEAEAELLEFTGGRQALMNGLAAHLRAEGFAANGTGHSVPELLCAMWQCIRQKGVRGGNGGARPALYSGEVNGATPSEAVRPKRFAEEAFREAATRVGEGAEATEHI